MCAHCPNDVHLHIHHIDGDPNNNSIENLMLLCNEHHAECHPENYYQILNFKPKNLGWLLGQRDGSAEFTLIS